MSISLHNLSNKHRKARRIGRGCGSGRGTYSTRGLKGQKARSGSRKGLKLKGFKKTLMSLPKFKGMLPRNPKNQVVLTSTLEKRFETNSKINPGTLKDLGLIDSATRPVKILFDKEVSKVFEVFECTISGKAKETVEKAGGKVLNSTEEEK